MQELNDNAKNYNFGLNEHHQSHIISYLKFARHQRMQAMKAVEYSFGDVMDSRLLEGTYTGEEVRELLTGLLAVVQGEVETELIDATHSNALLLKQLFSQAEAWHLRLQPDLSELHNRQEMEAVKAADERSHLPAKPCSPTKLRLAPLAAAGPAAVGLLHREIDALTADNARLNHLLSELQCKYDASCKETALLQEALDAVKCSIEDAQVSQTQQSPQPASMNELEEQQGRVRSLTTDLEQSSSALEQLQQDLSSSRQQLAAMQAQLTLAEQELERKFGETAAYANMKKMLSKKNEQIKQLRAKLQTLEPSADVLDETVV